MKLQVSGILFLGIAVGAIAACSDPTAPKSISRGMSTTASFTALSSPSASSNAATSCSFSRGTTTCVTTTRTQETETIQQFSGCLAGPPPFGPGRRIRTFENTYEVTTTTTELRRGRSDHVYSTSVSTDRVLVSSRLVSDTCERI